ncbi:MAG: peptidylprolyl isomerase, partial [Verrucomicrobiia bacterium]
MKKLMKMIFAATFAMALLVLPRVQAASANAAATNAPAASATDAKSVDAMTALFGDPVIVKGKGFEIKRSELDQVVTGLKSAAAAHGQAIPPAQLTQIEGQLLGRLIQVQLLLQKATDADKSNGVQKADLQMKALLERAGSQEVLDRQLKAVGMTPAELRAKVIQESTAQAVLTRELNVDVTDADAKKFYDEHPADFEQPEMAHVRHILLMTMDPVTRTPLTTDQQKAKQKQADDLLKRIHGGEDFATLAKQYSEDPGSKDNGGELPAFPRGQMVPEFEAAAFSLTNNQVSDVVTSSFGYHIIKSIDKTPAKKVDYATSAPKIKDYLVQQKSEKLAPAYLDKLKQAADVQVLDPDVKAAIAAAAAGA